MFPQTLRRLYAGLQLRINETKSAVAQPWDRKFLGYSFWVAKGREIKRKVAPKALEAMKDRVRQITCRNGGRSIDQAIAELRGYLLGWKEYFRLADTPGVFEGLDRWIRRRLRMVQLKQWKRGSTIFRQLRAQGISKHVSATAALFARSWWRIANHKALNVALPNSLYEQKGLPRLAA